MCTLPNETLFTLYMGPGRDIVMSNRLLLEAVLNFRVTALEISATSHCSKRTGGWD